MLYGFVGDAELPTWSYGIRYKYGMFEQRILEDGYQIQIPDYLLTYGNPWEIERVVVTYPVRFYGEGKQTDTGYERTGGEVVRAVAYASPIPGYNTYNTPNL